MTEGRPAAHAGQAGRDGGAFTRRAADGDGGKCADEKNIFGFSQNARYPDAPEVPETVLLNPVITPLSDEMEEGWEGCLSVPGLRGRVPRYTRLRYQGADQFGNLIDRTVDGFHARVVQHECDHLVGMLYPMRIKDFSQFGFTEVLFPGLDPRSDD